MNKHHGKILFCIDYLLHIAENEYNSGNHTYVETLMNRIDRLWMQL